MQSWADQHPDDRVAQGYVSEQEHKRSLERYVPEEGAYAKFLRDAPLEHPEVNELRRYLE
ncbi:hypothetical protein D9M68_796500 [compost metagenome]